jgi:hypothetical protein
MVRKENIIIGAGLLISIVAIAHLVKAEDGGDDNKIVDKDAVVSWGDWTKCNSEGKKYRYATLITPAIGNGKTPLDNQVKDCTPAKEDDPIAWENWNSTRIINEYKKGNISYIDAYNELDNKHGWSNNDITESLVLDAENSSFISSSQSYMSEFY